MVKPFRFKNRKELLYEVFFFIAGVVSISLLWSNNLALTALLALMWIVAIKVWHSKDDIIIYIISAILGPSAEIVAINFGAWNYSNPSFLGIPIWLPFLWGMAGVLLNRIAKNLTWSRTKK